MGPGTLRGMLRRVLAPIAVGAFALSHVLAGGCSSSSSLAGGGACDGFCARWAGSDCRNRPGMEACLAECRDEQSRCRPEANALLRCATIDGEIVCDSSSGAPRIVGCAPREVALDGCMACDRVCERWVACGHGPSREECLAGCVDPRCAASHRALLDCIGGQAPRCDPETGPTAPAGCMAEWSQAAACMSRYGAAQPFRWLPVEPLPGDSAVSGDAAPVESGRDG